MKYIIRDTLTQWISANDLIEDHLGIPFPGTTSYAQPISCNNTDEAYHGKWPLCLKRGAHLFESSEFVDYDPNWFNGYN